MTTEVLSVDTASILVVGRQSADVDLLAAILGQNGSYQVQVVSNGAQALEAVRAVSPPDMVLLQVELPDMSGFDLCRQIVDGLGTGKQIPVLFLSSGKVQQEKAHCFEVGAVDYLVSPFEVREVLSRVDAQLTLIQAQRQIGHLEKALSIARMEAESANLAKGEFLASMSHELRTPLTSIIGNGELLAGKYRGTEDGQMLQSIVYAGRNQLVLVNDILDMLKIEAGTIVVEDAPYNLSTLLDDLYRMQSIRAQDAGLNFNIELKDTEDQQLMGDAHRINQILMNLIGNAIKFTEQGWVTLTVWHDQESLQFKIEDSGVGMSTETMEKIFHRFQQADGSISRRFGGNGLGLYISLNLAEMMGGTINASSELGAGSAFQLSLPYRISNLAAEHAMPGSGQADEGCFRGTVLVAEDTPALQLLEQRILEKMGLDVSVADNGEQVIELVSRQPFDLILMDMQMPGMDGITATRQLRDEGNRTPIVALTANVLQKHREAFEAAGCNAFLAKPIDRGALIRVLKQFLVTCPSREMAITEQFEQEQQWRVLAVDDKKDVLMLYQQLFSDGITEICCEVNELVGDDGADEQSPLRFRVDVASSGQEGYQKIETSIEEGDPYSVVLLDMRMPGGWDGLETAERIRAIDGEVRIIFVTAYMDYALKEILERIGVNFEFLQKPVNDDELVQLVLSLANAWGQYRELMRVHNLFKGRNC